MVNVDAMRTAMGVIGNIISVGLFLSPLPVYKGIVEKKDTEKFQPYIYLATLMNCALWVFYGSVHPDSLLVVTINGFGLVVEFVYLAIFFIYTKPKHKKNMIIAIVAEIVAMIVIVTCSLKLLHTTDKRSTVVGIICMIFNILMYAAPLSNFVTVIKKKSSKYVPFWVCFAGFCNGCCWFAYGFLKTFDINLVIPNGLGALFSAISIILFLIYRNNDYDIEQQQTDNIKPSKNVQLVDVV